MRSMTFRLLLFTFVSLGVFVIPAYAGSESGSPARPSDSGRRADGDQAWWDGFSLNGTDPTPEGMTVYNGNLVVCGGFTSAGGVPAGAVAQWDGQAWSALGLGVSERVVCATSWNGKLVVGGVFHTAGGNPAHNIAAEA